AQARPSLPELQATPVATSRRPSLSRTFRPVTTPSQLLTAVGTQRPLAPSSPSWLTRHHPASQRWYLKTQTPTARSTTSLRPSTTISLLAQHRVRRDGR